MEAITRSEIKKLAQETNKPSVSIFLQLNNSNDDAAEGRRRFQQLISKGKAQLEEWQDQKVVQATFGPALALLNDDNFWAAHTGSLAVFLAEGRARKYAFSESIRNQVVVSDRFHIRPLLNAFVHNGEYYILAISRASARLLAADQQGAREITIPDLPRDIRQLFKRRPDERVPARVANGGVSFHAMAPATQRQDVVLEDYCRLIDRYIRKLMGGKVAPLVLAGLPTIQATFRKVTHYPNLVPETLTTNPDRLSNINLHRRSWGLVASQFKQADFSETERYAHVSAREPKKITADIEEIVRSAQVGRIDTLLIKPGHHIWGVYDEELDDVMVHSGVQPGNYDLLDAAASRTFNNGGRVLPFAELDGVNLPKVAAILRY